MTTGEIRKLADDTRLAFSGAVFLVLSLSACSPRAQPQGAAQHTRLSVSASTTGRFAEGCSWHLSVNSEGRAHLTVDTYPQQEIHEFEIKAEQIKELAEVVEREGFFSLRSNYGEQV